MPIDTILNQPTHQLSIDDLLAAIEAEENEPDNGLRPGTAVKHLDLDVYGIYEGPSKRPGIALVHITSGWTCEPPAHPVSIPYHKLETL
jgi:hypothetical protein